MSTSAIKELIDAGELTGWDDPRAPTITSLQRRGIRGQAIVDAMVQLGTSTSNVDLAMSSIYAANRELIDEETDRAFFVRDDDEHGGLVERQVIGGPDVGEPPVHPNHEDRGTREIPVAAGVAIEGDDLPPHGDRVWLKGYGCVRHTRDAFEYVGDDIEVVREEGVDVIHWTSADGPELRLRTMNGDVEGVAEPGIGDYDEGTMVQFERVGFASLDNLDSDPAVAYYAHP